MFQPQLAQELALTVTATYVSSFLGKLCVLKRMQSTSIIRWQGCAFPHSGWLAAVHYLDLMGHSFVESDSESGRL